MQNFIMNGDPKVYQVLKELGIPFEYLEHPPAPTIAIASRYWSGHNALHCKNLFFRNHKGNRHYLVLLDCRSDMDIHQIEKKLRQGKLSFASAERMMKYLGLEPGSVSPFGLIHDSGHHVHLFIDNKLRMANRLSFHPNLNTASLMISSADFFRFLNHCGNTFEFLDLCQDPGGGGNCIL